MLETQVGEGEGELGGEGAVADLVGGGGGGGGGGAFSSLLTCCRYFATPGLASSALPETEQLGSETTI